MSALMSKIWKNREVYLLLAPGVIWYILFAFVPMAGLILAFKTFRANLGILGSPWAGLSNFTYVFRDFAFVRSVFRTLQINAGRIAFVFPFPILLALAINEIRLGKTKKVLQTVYTFPNFLSWVIVSSIMTGFLSLNGLVNSVIKLFGSEGINFLGNTSTFLPMVYVTDIWKTSGWSAIIYMAAISGIDQDQYEAAEIDGASRLQRIWHITLPGIRPTIVIMFVLSIGYLMSMGFDQIFNISNAVTIKSGEILDMYIYRVTFQAATDFSFSTAVSLFRSVINFALLVIADRVVKLFGGEGLIAR